MNENHENNLNSKEEEKRKKREHVYWVICDDVKIKFPVTPVYRCDSRDCKKIIVRNCLIETKEKWEDAIKPEVVYEYVNLSSSIVLMLIHTLE